MRVVQCLVVLIALGGWAQAQEGDYFQFGPPTSAFVEMSGDVSFATVFHPTAPDPRHLVVSYTLSKPLAGYAGHITMVDEGGRISVRLEAGTRTVVLVDGKCQQAWGGANCRDLEKATWLRLYQRALQLGPHWAVKS